MRPVKIIGVARDLNPSNFLKTLEEYVNGIVAKIELWTGDQANADGVAEKSPWKKIKEADSVILGMSSSPKLSQFEREVADWAYSLGKRNYGFISDAPGAFTREWFERHRKDASFVAVLREYEVERAKRLFPNALVRAVGSPSWETALDNPMGAREVRRILGVSNDEKLVLIAGTKKEDVNREAIHLVAEALKISPSDKPRKKVVFSKHPSDTTPTESYAAIDPSILVAEKSIISTDQALWGAHLFVNLLSTDGDKAAYRRKTMIHLMSKLVAARRLEQLGTRIPFEHGLGVTWLGENASHLSNSLNDLCSNPYWQREAQERHYPLPPPRKGTWAQSVLSLILEAVPAQSQR